jgi:transposase-like protein
MVAKADRRAEERRGIGRAEIPARVGIDAIRGLLAAHPEPAPVASRERVTASLLKEWLRRAEDRTVASPEEHCLGHADALLAAGVFRDEAEVKAEALREAAEAWDQADRDGSIGAFADKHYSAGHNLPSLWLHHRAEEAAR